MTDRVPLIINAGSAQIQELPTADALSVVGNILGGNIISTAVVSAASISATGNITGGNLIVSGVLVDSTGNLELQSTALNGNINLTPAGTGIVGIATTLSVTSNVQGGNLRTVGLISATGGITGAGITGTSLTVSTGAVTLGSIVNANANGVGNIGAVGGYFNTVFAKATSAQYADLAEMYMADAAYTPGTVLIFGGDKEVTANITSHSTAVAGVVSKNPSHLMNAGLQGATVVPLALLGRVQCNVQGVINKGDLLVCSDTPGTAIKLNPALYQPGCVIGKSLENYNSDRVGQIEIAVGIK
jgi:hypothetical protein